MIPPAREGSCNAFGGKRGTPTPVGWGGGAGVGAGAGHPALREVARGVSGKSNLTNLLGRWFCRFQFAHWRNGADIEAVTLEGPRRRRHGHLRAGRERDGNNLGRKNHSRYRDNDLQHGKRLATPLL